MYLRHGDSGNAIFVPEDDHNTPRRDWVPTGTVRQCDPPTRRHFVNSLPPHKRATALIRGYVERLVETRGNTKGKHADGAADCRRFLKAWHSLGDDSGIDLAVMPAGRGAVQFYFRIHGVGPVVWLPVLVTAANEHTAHILRETGPCRVVVPPDPRPARRPEDEPRRGFPPEVDTVLIKGKRG